MTGGFTMDNNEENLTEISYFSEMDHIKTPIFQALFQSDVPRIILKANSPHFTVMDYNSAYLNATENSNADKRGDDFWRVYQTYIAKDTDSDLLAAALEKAIVENHVITLPSFRFDMVSKTSGEVMPKWWQLEVSIQE